MEEERNVHLCDSRKERVPAVKIRNREVHSCKARKRRASPSGKEQGKEARENICILTVCSIGREEIRQEHCSKQGTPLLIARPEKGRKTHW